MQAPPPNVAQTPVVMAWPAAMPAVHHADQARELEVLARL